MKRGQQGFTLIELAIVLVVLTILATGLLVPLTTSIETRRIQQTSQDMAKIQDALLGYAMSHPTSPCTCNYDSTGTFTAGTCPAGNACPASNPYAPGSSGTYQMIRHYLPCPDINSDGQEDRDATTPNLCAIAASANGNNSHPGWLPWVTLNLPETDAWGSRFAYDVYLPYADSQAGFSSSHAPDPASPVAGELYVCNSYGCRLPAPNPLPNPSPYLATQTPAVVVSYGPNAQGAFNSSNKKWGANPDQTNSPDEYQNAIYGTNGTPGTATNPSNKYRAYVSRTPSDKSQTTNEFDDLVTWLSWPALINRVCPAGGCP